MKLKPVRTHSASGFLLIMLSWILGSALSYYSIINFIPLIKVSVFSTAVMFKIFIYLISLVIGMILIFYSMLCIMHS